MATCRQATSARIPPIAACVHVLGRLLHHAQLGAMGAIHVMVLLTYRSGVPGMGSWWSECIRETLE
jgi:hypothetical protein